MPLDPNKLQAAVDAYQPDNSRLRSTAADSMSLTPDTAARANTLAKRNGWNPQIVASDLPGFSADELNRQLDDLRAKQPKAADWLDGDPHRVAMVRDDVPGFSKLAGAVSSIMYAGYGDGVRQRYGRILGHLQAGEDKPVGGLMREAGEGITSLFAPIRDLFLQRMQGAGGAVPPMAAASMFGALQSPVDAGEALAAKGADIYDFGQALSDEASQGVTRPTGIGDALVRPGNTFDYYAGMGAESLPAMLFSILGGPTAGPYLAGLTQQGQSYGEDRAQGYDKGTAFKDATAQGILEALGEVIPFHQAFAPGGSVARRFLRTTAAESASEAVTQAGQDVATTAITGEQMTWRQRLANVFDASILGGLMAAPLGAAGAAHEVSRERAIEADRKRSNAIRTALDTLGNVHASGQDNARLGAMTTLAQESRLGDLAPDQAEAFVDHIGGKGANVYVPATEVRTLFQDEAPRVAEQLTGDPSALALAGETGDLVIPLAKWVSTVAKMPEASKLLEVARTRADGLSPKELANTNVEELLKELAPSDADTAQRDAFEADRAGLEAAVAAQLQGAIHADGKRVYDDSTVATNAKIFAAAVASFAHRASTSPETQQKILRSVYAKYGLTIQGEGNKAAAQAAPVSMEPQLGGSLYRRGNGRRVGSAEALQRPDGSWLVRHRRKNGDRSEWSPWEARDTFDASSIHGYRASGTPSGLVKAPGHGAFYVNVDDTRAEGQTYNPLLDLIAGAGGISRADARRFGVDPAEMNLRRGIKPLFSEMGIPLDKLRESMQEEGYFPPEDPNAPPTIDLNDVWDLVSQALGGDMVAPLDDADADAIRMQEAEARQAEDAVQPASEDETAAIDDLLNRLMDAGMTHDTLGAELEALDGASAADKIARLSELAQEAEAGGPLFQTPSSEAQSGVEFARGQETVNARLEQWSAAHSFGGSGPRAVDARPESIGPVHRNAAGAAEQGDASKDEIREQSARLIERAKSEGFFWPNDSAILAELERQFANGGAEHQVYSVGRGNERVVIRATDNGYFGPRSDISPAQYLARLDDYSAAFPSLQTRLIGVSESPYVEGHAVIWTVQPFVFGERASAQSKLVEAMEANGWESVDGPHSYEFRNKESGVVISDAHTENVYYDENGVYPFDVVVTQLPKGMTLAQNPATPQTDTPAFKAWFGDSKVVDADGKPLVVYHGTAQDFDTFDSTLEKSGQGFNFQIPGFWFAAERDIATRFGQNVQEVHLSLQNPAKIEAAEYLQRFVYNGEDAAAYRAGLEKKGHDGLIIEADPEYENNRGPSGTDEWGQTNYVAFRPEQIKSATGNRGTFDPSNPSILFQPAYHGTPHTVDRFSLQKIGTGEGAQAYGWGMYFASNKEIAEHYKNALADDANLYVDGKPVADATQDEWSAIHAIAKHGGDIGRTISALRKAGKIGQAEYLARMESAGAQYRATGNLYRVEVPEDSDLLDYDKKLSEQPEGVREKLRPLIEKVYGDKADTANPVMASFYHRLGTAIENEQFDESKPHNISAQQMASEALLAVSIPGLRYLDGGSRNKGEGSHNYVIWDENAIGDPEALYARNAAGPQGQIQFGHNPANPKQTDITLFNTADKTTFLHEVSHFLLEMMGDLAADPNTEQGLKDDYAKIRAFIGVPEGEAIQPEHHEKFARSFELYLREGKAPSPELTGAFARVRRWFADIYKSAQQLFDAGALPLDDDIRGVFDRILATDEEIELATKRAGLVPMVEEKDAASLGLTPEQWAAYTRALEDATDETRERVTNQVMAAVRREHSTAFKAAVKAQAEAMRDALEQTPAFKAWRALSAKDAAIRLSLPDLRSIVDAPALDAMRKLKVARNEGGVHPDIAAAALGFDSGDALLKALSSVPAQRDGVPAQAEAAVRADPAYSDPMTDGTLPERVEKALFGSKRLAALEAELGMLAKLVGGPTLTIRQLHAVADRVLAGKTSRTLRPHDYLVAERKAAREALKAVAGGKFREALRFKREQALNAVLYARAQRAQSAAERQAKAIRKAGTAKTFKRMGKAGKSYVDALTALLEGHELSPVSGKAVARREALRAWVARMQDAGYSTAVADDLLARVESEKVTNLADLSLPQLADLHEAVANLLHLARTKNRLQTARGRMEWKEAKALLVERLQQQPRRHGGKGITDADRGKLDILRDFGAAVGNWVLQPETIIEWLDGGTEGPFHDILWLPSEDAENTRYRLQKRVGDLLQTAFDALPSAERKALDDKFHIASLDRSLSGHTILSALLNMGNAGNRDKLLRGGFVEGDGVRQFTPEALAEMFSKLSRPQAELVQGIWDAVNSLWPDIVALEEELNGITPEKIEATPVTIRTKDGLVTLRGGYFPAMYDPKGSKAGVASEDEQAKRVLSGQAPIRASTSKGHVEKRTDFTAPLLLDYHAVLSRHLGGVIGDIAYRKFLPQMYRVLKDPEIARLGEGRLGPVAVRALTQGFERGAVGHFSFAGPLFGPMQGVADRGLTNVAVAALGLRVPLAAANIVTAPILAEARLGTKFLIAGFRDYYLGRGMKASTDMIHALSPMMQQRAEARTLEMTAILAQLRGLRGMRQKLMEMAMTVHQWIVPLAERAIWIAAYKQAQAGGKDITASAQFADKVIRQTQTKSRAKDLSMAEGSPYLRYMMMFAGPMVVANNRLQESGLRGLRGDVQSVPQALGVWIAFAAGNAILFDMMMGRGPDDDDDGLDAKDWLAWSAKKIALMPFYAYPVLRDVVNYLDNGFDGGNPLVQAAKKLADFGKVAVQESGKAIDGEDVDEKKLAFKTLDAAGVVTGIPSNQLKKSGEYAASVMTGEHQVKPDPREAYYLLQGPPKDE